MRKVFKVTLTVEIEDETVTANDMRGDFADRITTWTDHDLQNVGGDVYCVDIEEISQPQDQASELRRRMNEKNE